MSRKDKKKNERQKQDAVESVSEYYKLKTQAVEDLVTANEENSPPVSSEEIRKYTSRGRVHVAEWIKLLLIKWWFAAAVCFFFLWGLGTYVQNLLDLLVVTGIALGFVTDLLTNNVLRFVADRKGGNDRWMMYPKKGYISLPLNIVHSGIVLFLIYTAYNAINGALIAMRGLETDSVPLGVEPILFGLLYVGFDMLLITMKHVFLSVVSDAQKKAGPIHK